MRKEILCIIDRTIDQRNGPLLVEYSNSIGYRHTFTPRPRDS